MSDTNELHTAAGVLLYCPAREAVFLLLRTAGEKKEPGTWDIPGGSADQQDVAAIPYTSETPTAVLYCAARREFREEMGFDLPWPPAGHYDHVTNDGTTDFRYRTFIVEVPESRYDAVQRDTRINEEHDAARWFGVADLPLQLHPCLPAALAAFGLIRSAAAVYARAAADALWNGGFRAAAIRLVAASADDIEHIANDDAVLYRNRNNGRSVSIPEEKLALVSVSAGQWAPGRYSAAHRLHESGDYAYATLQKALRELTDTLPIADESVFSAQEEDEQLVREITKSRDDLRTAVTALERIVDQIHHVE